MLTGILLDVLMIDMSLVSLKEVIKSFHSISTKLKISRHQLSFFYETRSNRFSFFMLYRAVLLIAQVVFKSVSRGISSLGSTRRC